MRKVPSSELSFQNFSDHSVVCPNRTDFIFNDFVAQTWDYNPSLASFTRIVLSEFFWVKFSATLPMF